MTAKPKILFIGDYCRTDYLSLLRETKGYASFYFLFYTSPDEETNKDYKAFGQAIYWQHFKEVFSLLQFVQPTKVIFLYIESFNHVVLNLACGQRGIPTYQLEHGLRADYVAGFDPTFSPWQKVTFFQKLQRLYLSALSFSARVKNRLFLLNSIRRLPADDRAFVKEFIRIRKKHNFLETSRLVPSSRRTAGSYISFSKKIYQILQREDNLPINKEVFYIGVPYFDHLAGVTAAEPLQAILFIDQPLAEQGLLGWSAPYKASFAEQLASVCRHLDYTLYVKPHPLQDLMVWHTLSREYPVKLVSDVEVTALVPHLRVVLGFYSTYLLPFAALDFISLITYHKHPSGGAALARVFEEAGVAHPILDLQDLYRLLPAIDELHQQQLPHKASFTEEWLYKFDGKAGERLRGILLSNKL